jgi:uncharacterized membrane protein YozB (DUF420 family)
LIKARTQARRLLTLAVVAGALATLFAGAPAVGGKALSDSLDATFGLSFPVWQVLCTVAAICALSAAISTQLLKSQNLEERVSKAESVRARLEILDIGRITGTLTPQQIAAEYTACVALVSFI